MPRSARIVAPNVPYHITQRGNYRQNIFQDDDDRARYLAWINEYSKKYQLSVLAYCLMDNHVHFIGLPQESDSLARVFSVAHMRYSQYFNRKRKAAGHLWQGRFYSCALDEPYLIAAIRYVERNPVRAGMVNKPWEWAWSSTRDRMRKGRMAVQLGDVANVINISADDWMHYVDTDDKGEELKSIRQHTQLGRPLGSVAFMTKVGEKVGRVLQVVPRGRPRERTINK